MPKSSKLPKAKTLLKKRFKSYKDEMANLQKALDAEKATKEEAEKKASEEKLNNEHENAIFQAREEGCDESFFSAADEVNGLKNKIYRASYGSVWTTLASLMAMNSIAELCYAILEPFQLRWQILAKMMLLMRRMRMLKSQ